MYDNKSLSLWLPGKIDDIICLLWQLQDFHRNVFLPNPKQLEAIVGGLLRFGMAIDSNG